MAFSFIVVKLELFSKDTFCTRENHVPDRFSIVVHADHYYTKNRA